MLRKSILGVLAMVVLLVVTTGTASAHGYHHGCGGYRGGYGYGYRGGYGYGYAPRVYVAPAPVYGYPAVGGYGYGVQPGYGYGAYGYGQPGIGVTTPGFGMYVR